MHVEFQTEQPTAIEDGGREAESGLLGSILIDPSSFKDVEELTPDHFRYAQNRWVWEAILFLAKEGTAIDFITLTDAIRRMGRHEEVDEGYVIELINCVPTSINLSSYAKLVKDAKARRDMVAFASWLATETMSEGTLSPDEILLKARAMLDNIGMTGGGRSQSLREIVLELIDKAEDREEEEDVGVLTGLSDLDKILGGLKPGKYYLVGARPGMGKSSLLGDFVVGTSERGAKVAAVVLEMGADEIVGRLVASRYDGDSGEPLKIHPGSSNYMRFLEACGELSNLPVEVAYLPGAGIATIRAELRHIEKKLGGLDVVVIDYLQLMSSDGRSFSRENEVAKISRGLKLISQEFDAAVVVASQLSRALENRQDKRPTLHDLRDSGSLEQDADVVLFIYREDYYDEFSDRSGEAEIIAAKHRGGGTGTAKVVYRAVSTSFRNMAYEVYRPQPSSYSASRNGWQSEQRRKS